MWGGVQWARALRPDSGDLGVLWGWPTDCNCSMTRLPRESDLRFMRPKDVVEMLGVSRTTLWRLCRTGTFPRPVRVSPGRSAFVYEAVQAWMNERVSSIPGSGPAALASQPASGRDPYPSVAPPTGMPTRALKRGAAVASAPGGLSRRH